MRPRLLLLIVAAAVVALLSGTSRAGAGTAACTATATGKHVRTQLLKVHLTGTCPVSGVAHGTLTFSQWPRIHADGVFALDYAAGTLWLHVPRKLSMKPAWTARAVTTALHVSVQASPRRRLSGRGRYSIHGSTNLNYRSLEKDKDFELVICVDDEGLAQEVLREVRDVDIPRSVRFTRRHLRGLRGRFRVRTRDPRTLLLLSRRVL